MRSVIAGFATGELSKEFYLAGGTALALQMGHRLSVDLDFFSPTQEDIPALAEPLRHAMKEFSPILSDSPRAGRNYPSCYRPCWIGRLKESCE